MLWELWHWNFFIRALSTSFPEILLYTSSINYHVISSNYNLGRLIESINWIVRFFMTPDTLVCHIWLIQTNHILQCEFSSKILGLVQSWTEQMICCVHIIETFSCESCKLSTTRFVRTLFNCSAVSCTWGFILRISGEY